MRIIDIKPGYKFRYANDAYEIINIDDNKEIIYIKNLSDIANTDPSCVTFTAFTELCVACLITQLKDDIWLDLEERLQSVDTK